MTMGTYLEDYLESMYMLPSEIKRNFDLMRELDKTTYPLYDELKTFHVEYLVNARKKVVERCMNTELGDPDEQELRELVETDTILEQLRSKLQRVTQKLDEKIAIAAQSYDLVDHNIRRLDQDLDAYAALLKQNGEYEDDKVMNVKKRKIQENTEGVSTNQPEKPTTATNVSTTSATTIPTSTISSQRQQNQPNGAFGRKATGTSSRKRTVAVSEPTPGILPVVSAPVSIGAEDLPIDPNEPIYCHCRRVSYGQMVGCDNDDCKYEWFHFECVGLTDQPQGKWYCKDCRNMLGLK